MSDETPFPDTTDAPAESVEASTTPVPESDDPVLRVDYAARRRDRAQSRKSERLKKTPLILVAAVIALLLGALVVEAAVSYGRIHPGVSVSGVEVGGMTKARAAAKLREYVTERTSRPVAVTHASGSWVISADQVGLEFDTDLAVTDAFRVGREKKFVSAAWSRVTSWVSGRDIDIQSSVDDTVAESAFAPIADTVDVKPVDSSVKRSGLSFSVVNGTDGTVLDRSALGSDIAQAILSAESTISAPMATASMDVTPDEAKDAAETAARLVNGPVSVTFQTGSWTFEPDKIAPCVMFARSDEVTPALVSDVDTASAEVTLLAVFSPDSVGSTMLPVLGAGIGRAAVDARFETANGSVRIVPSQQGIGPDLETLCRDMLRVLNDPAAQRTVELRTRNTDPVITTAEAQAMGIKDRLSKYTTTYDAWNKPRVNNIHLLGDSLDGTLIAPGATFSFNGTVGERTADKGYKEAPAIVGGKLVPQLGGGICQVGTTLFNAVFESGLPVVERNNHSFYISHYPKGRDATVSWGGPDLKFKNDTENWILISVSYTSSSITIALYGTSVGYSVESQTGAWYDVKPFPIQEVPDPTLAAGKRVVEDSGENGRSIKVTRVVKQNGSVLRSDTFVSRYRTKTQVVRVGTKVAKPSGTPTTTP